MNDIYNCCKGSSREHWNNFDSFQFSFGFLLADLLSKCIIGTNNLNYISIEIRGGSVVSLNCLEDMEY